MSNQYEILAHPYTVISCMEGCPFRHGTEDGEYCNVLDDLLTSSDLWDDNGCIVSPRCPMRMFSYIRAELAHDAKLGSEKVYHGN